ncbi:hypothetical protein C7H62_2684 [Mesoflavibacter sp. HG96]|uniref:hypothetical protein n=1 Tax=unclassified Mesoflavibacter TaxID=2630131 RepID=UPI000D0F12A3|nr:MULTISPECIES: hypothetical protein [unclassified Mesoflavibacter]QIJ90492.1 hypothetical protein C7H62_2684 [Mesoflavibacter sp. HG96]QIJ93220.1 hypothetical protein C7H56_2684 [Mesoflavibacter sp. HG37]
MGIINYYNISHAEVFVFDDFLIKQVKEGVKIDLEETEELKLILEEHFKNKKMAYISNRVTSYSVNPLVYKEVEKMSNLVAIAIIPKDEKMRQSAEFERQFFNKPFEIFENLSDAIQWVQKIILNENKEAIV